MIRVLGERQMACDGLTRREAIRVVGMGLFGGLSLPTLLHACTKDDPRVIVALSLLSV